MCIKAAIGLLRQMFLRHNDDTSKFPPRSPVPPQEASIPFLVVWHSSSLTSRNPSPLANRVRLFKIQQEEGKQMPFVFSFPIAAVAGKADLPDLSFALFTKLPTISVTSGLQRLSRQKGVSKVLALDRSSFLTCWGANMKASGGPLVFVCPASCFVGINALH